MKQEDLNNQLIIAIRNRDINKVNKCVNNGANVNHTDYAQQTPLVHAVAHAEAYAVEFGDHEIVKFLLDHGASLETHSHLGITIESYTKDQKLVALLKEYKNNLALLNAVIDGYQPKEVLENLTNLPLNTLDMYGRTPLHEAIYACNIEMISYLINQEGINLNAKNRQGQTPLDYAHRLKNVDAAKLLSDAGAIRNSQIDGEGKKFKTNKVPELFSANKNESVKKVTFSC
jgi:ankyrin repeat protein